MKTSLYSSLSLLIFLVISIDSQSGPPDEDFCQMTDPIVSRAFIIQKDIYFGDDLSFWKMNVESFDISKKKKAEDLFSLTGGVIPLKRITSAVHFGSVTCDPKSVNCVEIKKAENVVLAVGTLSNMTSGYGYKAYKAFENMDLTSINDISTMPWQLASDALLKNGAFWIQTVNGVDVDEYGGMTFDETTKTIYMAVVAGGKNTTNYRTLNDNGVFEGDFKVMPEWNLSYTGLIDWKGMIYGLSGGKFYLLPTGNDLTANKEFNFQQFFNCDGNSPLNEFKLSTTSESNANDSEANPQQPEDPQESASPNNEEDSFPDTTPPQSTTPIGSKSESKSNWILWVIIIVIILVIVLIIVCLFCCRKSGESAAQDKESHKSKPDSEIISEGGSKAPSAPSAIQKTGSATSLKKGSKSDSREDSSVGSKPLRKASSKSESEIESVASVRSKIDQ